MNISIGTVQWGLKYGISNRNGIPSDNELKAILDIAKSNKISLLDTASQYGNAENRIGEFASKDFEFITKISLLGDTVEEKINKSFINLKRNSIYGCLFHNIDELIENKNNWKKLLKFKQNGKIEKIGYSLYEPKELIDLLNLNLIPDIIQIPFSLLDRKFEPYFDILKNKGVEIHIRSIFLQGLYFKNINRLSKPLLELSKPLLELQLICKKYSISILELALGYVAHDLRIDFGTVGIETPNQLKEIIIASKTKLSKGIIEEVRKIEIKEKKLLNPSYWKKK